MFIFIFFCAQNYFFNCSCEIRRHLFVKAKVIKKTRLHKMKTKTQLEKQLIGATIRIKNNMNHPSGVFLSVFMPTNICNYRVKVGF